MCGNESIINEEQRFLMYGGEKMEKIEEIEKIWGYLHEASRSGGNWHGYSSGCLVPVVPQDG